jgi:hypothetical protein
MRDDVFSLFLNPLNHPDAYVFRFRIFVHGIRAGTAPPSKLIEQVRFNFAYRTYGARKDPKEMTAGEAGASQRMEQVVSII